MLLEICGIDHHNLFVLAHSERLIPRLIDALASAAVGITTDLKVASADIVAPPTARLSGAEMSMSAWSGGALTTRSPISRICASANVEVVKASAEAAAGAISRIALRRGAI